MSVRETTEIFILDLDLDQHSERSKLCPSYLHEKRIYYILE